MSSSRYNHDQALAGMQVQSKRKCNMLWAERFKDRIRRFVKTRLRASVPPTGSFDRTQAYPYVPSPGATEFRAVLADEYGKAAQSQKNLAVLYVDLPDCLPEWLEEIDVLLRSVTETRDTVFLYSPTGFALILRKMGAMEAALLSLQIAHLVQTNFPEVGLRTNIAAYPEIVKNLAEFEARAPGITRSSQHRLPMVG